MSKSNQLLDALFARDKALASRISDEIALDSTPVDISQGVTIICHAGILLLPKIAKQFIDITNKNFYPIGVMLSSAQSVEIFKMITDKLGYTSAEKSFKTEITTLLNWALSTGSSSNVLDVLLDQATPDELNPYPMTTKPSPLVYTRSSTDILNVIKKMGKVDYIEQLHKALAAYNNYTAKELLKLIKPEELTRTDISGSTVLHTATRYFSKITSDIITLNSDLLTIKDAEGILPMELAAKCFDSIGTHNKDLHTDTLFRIPPLQEIVIRQNNTLKEVIVHTPEILQKKVIKTLISEGNDEPIKRLIIDNLTDSTLTNEVARIYEEQTKKLAASIALPSAEVQLQDVTADDQVIKHSTPEVAVVGILPPSTEPQLQDVTADDQVIKHGTPEVVASSLLPSYLLVNKGNKWSQIIIDDWSPEKVQDISKTIVEKTPAHSNLSSSKISDKLEVIKADENVSVEKPGTTKPQGTIWSTWVYSLLGYPNAQKTTDNIHNNELEKSVVVMGDKTNDILDEWVEINN